MYFLFLFLILFKLVGMFFAYQVYLPDRFPPETVVTRVGYFIFSYLGKLIRFLNIKISLFPSVFVPIFERASTKLLFLRLPFILIDFLVVIIAVFVIFKKRKSLYPFLFFSSLNFWSIFYFNSQRLSFEKEIYNFFLRPYKLDFPEKSVILSFLIIYFLLVVIVLHLKLRRKRNYQNFLKKVKKTINFRFLWFVMIFLYSAYLLNYSGILLKLSREDRVDWKGFWIKPSGDLRRENIYYIFEKDFYLFFTPSEARIFSFCQGDYLLYINKRLVGQGGLISNNDFAYYDYWSVESFLKKGKNLIHLECYNPDLETLSLVKKPPGMIFQLEARDKLFKKVVASDSSWRSVVDTRYLEKVEFVSKATGFQEFFDNLHNKEPHWGKAQIIDKPPLTPWTNLIMRPIPYLQEQSVFPGKSDICGFFTENPKVNSPDLARVIGDGIKEISGNCSLPYTPKTRNTFIIFDFGKIVVGYPKLKIFSQAGGRIDFGFAEILKDDGSPDVAKMVSQADQLIFDRGDFSYSWRQRRAFRYAILIFKNFDQPIMLDEFSMKAVNYPADDEESFLVTSDNILNKIFAVSKYTAKIARQGSFEDCPHREKAQYVGDMRIVSLVNYYNYSDKELIKKALWEFALSQGTDGFIQAVYPSGRRLLIPDYSAQWVSAVWEYYLYSGDLDFLQKIYPFLRKQMEGFINYSDKDGLVRNQNDWWVFIDQGDQEMNLDKSISLNIFYLEALRNIVNIAKETKNNIDEERYKKLAGDVSKLINERVWNNKVGLFDDCMIGNSLCGHFSRQTNFLALYQNMVEADRLPILKQNLLRNPFLPEVITPYFNSFVVEALFKNGLYGEAVNLIRNYWGGMLEKGATTFWETYDPKTGKENAAFGESLSHGWSSGPAYLLPKWILGVEPADSGYSSFRVKPVFADLSFAKGKIPIDKGQSIEVSWDINSVLESSVLGSSVLGSSVLEMKLKYNFFAKAELFLPFRKGQKLFLDGEEIKDLQYEGSSVKLWIEKPGEYEIVLRK